MGTRYCRETVKTPNKQKHYILTWQKCFTQSIVGQRLTRYPPTPFFLFFLAQGYKLNFPNFLAFTVIM